MKLPHIVVADDEPNLRKVLTAILERDGYEVSQASDGMAALALLDADVSVVITDLKMPELDGMAVLSEVAKTFPEVPVIMITAFGTVDNAVAAVKSGAFDYIEKPFEQEQIRQVVRKAVAQSKLNRSSVQTTSKESGRFGFIGTGAAMNDVFSIIEKVADTPSTVLITGESGTGKELVAKALHENSIRRNRAFIKINCAAIPKNLMESEFFGYEPGAFTGATHSKPGRFELASGGTLFLDEIGEIPVEMQVKLLRAIQEQEFERVGGIKTIKVDVRLITATNRNLEQEVHQGNFREDLFYRLNVVPLNIPPLRDRTQDIGILVRHILEKFNRRLNKEVDSIDDEALSLLRQHSWPGNIRELENVIERTILFASNPVISASDLPTDFANIGAKSSLNASTPTSHPLAMGESASLKEVVRAETNRVEKELIARALDETGGNVTKAAKLLKISRKSLQTKMKEFDLRDKTNQQLAKDC